MTDLIQLSLYSTAGILMLLVVGHGIYHQKNLLWFLKSFTVFVLFVVCMLGYKVFEPVIKGKDVVVASERKVTVPAYDYKQWRTLPVQFEGRTMPFDTASIQVMRHITGFSKFEATGAGEDDVWVKAYKRMTGKHDAIDPVAIVLEWMLLSGKSYHKEFVDWENYPFILCSHHDLRKEIYAHLHSELTEEQLHGKYIAPADLRGSPRFARLLTSVDEKRRADREKFQQILTPEERTAQEVAGRLQLYDSITQSIPGTFTSGPPMRRRQHPDPIHLVNLDMVKGGAWFSLADLRACEEDPGTAHDGNLGKWREEMRERLARTPQLYIAPEQKEALTQFQQLVKAGQGQKALEDLPTLMKEEREQQLKKLSQILGNHNTGNRFEMLKSFVGVYVMKSDEDRRTLSEILNRKYKEGDKPEAFDAAVYEACRACLVRQDEETIDNLKKRLTAAQSGKRYHPEDPEFRMLHLDYLEARYPQLYRKSAAWQEFPRADADHVLTSYSRLVDAYKSLEPEKFDNASRSFFDALSEVSEKYGPYPGDDKINSRLAGVLTGRPPSNPDASLIALETRFNRAAPYQWSWVAMLLAVTAFVGNMATRWRVASWMGYAFFCLSLALQVYGFYCRVAISARPPVSNMYETVIWVAFMTAIFALFIELKYPKKVVILSGSVVAALCLVLADQLPTVLDPKISPIVPVLRSNYWLTIHVLTIVSSYAGGALAWGLGNIALAMLAFGNPKREDLSRLSQYCYRAIQVAVLLLAAGTFLGGWWAADSWGRFWGWDPKEVWALIALICYVIPLHMRFVGWIKDFGLAVCSVLCFAAIVMCWYGVNFVLGAGLHSYGFGGGGPWWVFWFGMLNVLYVLGTSILYLGRQESARLLKKPATV